MALPSNATTGVVTGTFVDGQGTPLTGSVTFTPSTAVLDASGTTIIAPAPLTAQLDANGSFTITLVATDDAALNPSGWTWGVAFAFPQAKVLGFSFALPGGTTVDLSAASPVPTSTGTPIVVGPAGSPTQYDLRGTGSPLGVVTPGAISTYYTDIAQTNGAIRWVSTGTTSSSWIVAEGDTGWRALATHDATGTVTSGTYPAGITPSTTAKGGIYIRRVNALVTFLYLQVGVAQTPTVNQPIPSGFWFAGLVGSSGTYMTAGWYSTGSLSIRASGQYFYVNGNPALAASPYAAGPPAYLTADAWPTTLPGVAA